MKKVGNNWFRQQIMLIVFVLFVAQGYANNGIRLTMMSSNKNVNSNSISTQLTLQNGSASDIDLADVVLRYYYTKDNDKAQNFWFDNVAIKGSKYKNIKSKVEGQFVVLDAASENALIISVFRNGFL